MAALTWFMTNNLAGTAHQEMSETSPGSDATASPAVGWVVGTGATNHSALDAQSERASTTFTATTDPDGTPTTTAGAGDCLRSTNTYDGDFAAGAWTFNFTMIGVTQSGAQDGRIRFRLLRGANDDGSGATDISGAQIQCGLITNLTTTQAHSANTTYNPGAISVSNEYIFVQVAWERTGAGGMTTTNVRARVGTTATRVISTNFTPNLYAPDPPTGLGAVATSSTQIDLDWTAPVNDGGSAITGYKIERESPIGGGWGTLVADTGTTAVTYDDTSLTPGTEYNYRISAINAIGTSSPSTADAATTLDVPGQVTGLAATAVSDSQIDLSWSAPSSDGGSAITGYKIERESPISGGFSTLVADTGTTATTRSDTGLTPETQYNYRVSAINTIGTGTSSTADDATTTAAGGVDVNPGTNWMMPPYF